MFNFNKIKKMNSGVAILLTILIIGVLLSIVIALSGIFSTKIRLSSETKYSVGALYAAESGVECCLYKTFVDNTYPCDTLGISGISIGATFDTDGTCQTSSIRSIGNYFGVSRAIQVDY